MKNKINVGFVAAMLAVLFIPVISFAQTTPQEVMEVIVMDASDATGRFAPFSDQVAELAKEYDSPAERNVWFNAYAGNQSGLVIVTIRYPSIAAVGEDAEMYASPEFQAVMEEVRQTGFKIISRSLTLRVR